MATRDEILRILIEAKGDDELRALAKEFDKLAKSGDAAEDDITGFVNELDKLARADRSIGALVKLKAALSETGTNLERARQRVDQLEKEFEQAEKPTAKLRRELEAARSAVERLSKEQGRQTAELNRNANALRAAGIDTERLGSAQRQVRQDITNLSDRFRGYVGQLKEAGTSAARAAQGTRELGNEAKKAGGELAAVEVGLGKIAAAAAAAIAALRGIQFGGNLLADSAQLQSSLAEVQAIASAGAAEFALLREAAERAAAETGIAIGDVTAGLGELARAGFETKDTIAALRPALDLAQAGSLGLSEAVEITATTLTQFGEGADQAGRVADVLASAANSTQSSVEGLGRALTDVAPLARQLDISFEETVAILGRLADEGFRGSRAGTALRSAFAQLLDPSSKFREELSRLGITSTDFTTVLEELATKGDAGRNALLSLGQEAAPAILALASKGGGAIRALTTDLQGAEGSANAVAQVIRDTLPNAFGRLQQTAGNAINSLIDPLLRPLQGLLEDVTARLAAFASSEDFAKIRDGLALAFENGVETVRQFLDSADFSQITADVQTFAAEAGQRFEDLRENVDALVRGFEAIGSAVRIFGNAIQVAVSAAESNLLQLERRFLAAQQSVLQLSNAFGFVDDELAEIERRIGEIDRRQAQLRENGERDWGQLKQAAEDFGEAVSGADEDVKELGGSTGPLLGLAKAAQDLARKFGLIPPEVERAAEEVKKLPEAAAGSASAIEDENQRAAESFALPADASREAVAQILGQWRALRASLQNQAQEIAKKLAEAFDNPELSGQLKQQLDSAVGELAKADAAIKQTEQALSELDDKGKKAGEGLKGGAEQGSQALKQLGEDGEKAAEGVGEAGEAAQAAGGFAALYAQQLVQLREEFQGTSQAALDLFLSYQKLAARGGAGSDLLGLLDALAAAGAQTRRELQASRAAADVLAGDLRTVAQATDAVSLSASNLGAQFGGSTEAAQAELARLLAEIEALQAGVDVAGSNLRLLDKTSLAGLQREAQAAAQAIAQIEQQSRSAVEELARLNRELQDEADRAAGNQRDVLERELQDQLRRIDELAAAGGQAAQEQAQRARRLAQEEFTRRTRELEEQAKREEQAARESVERERAASEERKRIRTQEEEAFNRDLQRAGGGGIDVTRRVEIVLKNEQLPGRERPELTEEQIARLGEQLLARIAADGRGLFRR